jgi:hypothetical protein
MHGDALEDRLAQKMRGVKEEQARERRAHRSHPVLYSQSNEHTSPRCVARPEAGLCLCVTR